MGFDKFEQLKLNMDIEYKKYKELFSVVSSKSDTIKGCLNRIAVSNDDEEVQRCFNNLIYYYIKEYKDVARECHKQWLNYYDLFNLYLKEKNKGVNYDTNK